MGQDQRNVRDRVHDFRRSFRFKARACVNRYPSAHRLLNWYCGNPCLRTVRRSSCEKKPAGALEPPLCCDLSVTVFARHANHDGCDDCHAGNTGTDRGTLWLPGWSTLRFTNDSGLARACPGSNDPLLRAPAFLLGRRFQPDRLWRNRCAR